jgi:hypothetical protein
MRQCKVCKSTKGVHKFQDKTDLCGPHYSQMNRHGKILPRTKYTPNDFLDQSGYVEIVLYAENGAERGRALVDKEDLPKVVGRKWHVANRKRINYVESDKMLLHILILGRKHGFEIDHINGNGLDCRRSNLRFLTHAANILNRHEIRSKSGRMGVTWRADRNCWVARIIVKGKAIHRHCKSFDDATKTREAMELEYVGISASEIMQHGRINPGLTKTQDNSYDIDAPRRGGAD